MKKQIMRFRFSSYKNLRGIAENSTGLCDGLVLLQLQLREDVRTYVCARDVMGADYWVCLSACRLNAVHRTRTSFQNPDPNSFPPLTHDP